MKIGCNEHSSSSSDTGDNKNKPFLFKIPKNCASGVNQEAEGSFSSTENMNVNVMISNTSNNNKKNSKRVCPECNKEFETGKALGGHMRIHSKKQPMFKIPHPRSDSEIALLSDDQTYPCSLCIKKFPSSRALSGHMRCHPGRNWSGIRPPSGYYSSSFLEDDDDDDVDEDDEDDDEDEDDDDGDMVFDCSQHTSDWPVKARRGGKGKRMKSSKTVGGCEDDEEEMRSRASAADVLLSLKQVVDFSGPSRLSTLDAVGHEGNAVVAAAAAADRVAENHHVEIQSHGMNTESNQSEKAGIGSSVEAATSPVPTNNYKCSNCDKTFSSHQALVGYRCSHNTQTETEALPQPQLGVRSSGEEVNTRAGENRIRRLMGFDLNLPASVDDEA